MSRSRYIRFIAVILLTITFIVFAACVKIAEEPPKTQAGNMQPVISGFMAAQNQTYPGGTVNLQSVATDPNNDILTFKWTASGGSFVEPGRANTTWRAPNDFGDYEIKLTVDDGKGGTTQATVMIKVSANHPPAITSLTAEPASLQFSSRTTLTCIANDQDGDAVQFKWEAKEGSLSGVGNKVSWVSPSKGGSYSVYVIVSDGKGAETRQEIVIPVAAQSGVQTISMVKQESGTVSSDGNRDTSMYKAGDDDKNIGYRAFFSYNIFQLMGMEIKQARLKFIGTRVVGDDPFDTNTALGAFQIRHLAYGNTLPKFGIMEGGPMQRAELYSMSKTLAEVDVTPELITDVDNRLERFQAEAAFMNRTTNGNGIAQYMQWSDVVLEVTAAAK